MRSLFVLRSNNIHLYRTCNTNSPQSLNPKAEVSISILPTYISILTTSLVLTFLLGTLLVVA
jgi:hypothetical protein